MDTPWLKQSFSKPLYDDLLWSRPEQKAQAGKLLIVGGNSHAMAAPGEAFMLAGKAGAGDIKVVMPDKTRKLLGGKLPLGIELTPSTPSGSFSKDSLAPLQAYCAWADATLFAGDIGRNSETAIVLEQLASKMPGLQTYTRDAVDYFAATANTLLDRETTLLVVSLAQLQKIAISAKSQTAITFDMGLANLCSALSELTQVHKAHIITQQFSNIITAVDGKVIVTTLESEPDTWRLKTATTASVWWMQNPGKPLEAIATAITQIAW
jgi:hypothetical protein